MTKEDKVLNLIFQYGGIDGAHHKQWVLDQVVRILAGNQYPLWVEEYQNSVPDDDEYYEWDEGIAP